MTTCVAPPDPEASLPPYFQRLTRKEAKAYLARFIAELPACRERLAGMLASAGADPGLAQSFDPEAIDLIWQTAVAHWPMRWQDDYVHPPNTATPPIHKGTLTALGPPHLLPSWFIHDRIHALRFHQDTLWVTDVLGRHLGEALIAWRPSLGWAPGPARPASNIDRGCPVVASPATWVNPLRAMQGLVHRQITGDVPPDAGFTPRAMLERWKEYNWD